MGLTTTPQAIGDLVGPASVTDSAPVLFSGITGKLAKAGVILTFGTTLAANQSVTSSTTYVDTLLTVTLGPGKWRVVVNANFRNAGVVSGAKAKLTIPGATFLSGRNWSFVSNSAGLLFMSDQAAGGPGEISSAMNDSAGLGFDYTFDVAASAVITVQMAQLVSDGSAATMVIGSMIQATKLSA